MTWQVLTIVDTDVHTWNDDGAEEEGEGGGGSESRPKPPLDLSSEITIRLTMVGVSLIDSTPQVGRCFLRYLMHHPGRH